ncbi:hypothetical protein ACCS70_12665 [Rhizobium ruizarguesonis]|jgi:hypothetical protein|nr:hypothetical protein [Rhizobium ruizarguesonis]MCB2401713.1 hypothetical protein [Rhizobium ruizarguesonis]UED30948.1 hypothetical protein BSO17_21345 [Rhizobium ruizarguesonis]WSH01180.1 hypothetical protein U8P71_22795 [Rhizobium ruizarguesonis]
MDTRGADGKPAPLSGLTYETTRGYVKKVLAKTGTQRQSQLISLLSGLKI